MMSYCFVSAKTGICDANSVRKRTMRNSHSITTKIEVPQYHLIYKNESDEVPLCSYYTLIHGEPLKTETVATLEDTELKAIITQLATFLAVLHSIPLHQVTTLCFPIEKHVPTGRATNKIKPISHY